MTSDDLSYFNIPQVQTFQFIWRLCAVGRFMKNHATLAWERRTEELKNCLTLAMKSNSTLKKRKFCFQEIDYYKCYVLTYQFLYIYYFHGQSQDFKIWKSAVQKDQIKLVLRIDIKKHFINRIRRGMVQSVCQMIQKVQAKIIVKSCLPPFPFPKKLV